MFLVQTADMERIVLSPKYVDEIRSAPESVLSVRKGMCERHLGKFTTLDIILTSHLQNDVCKAQLTQNLTFLIGPINEEVGFWLNQMIPDNEARVELLGHQTILRVIAGVTSRVLIGLPISRDIEWLDVAMGYTLDVFQVSTALRPYPPILRSFVAPWLESTRRLKGHIQTANKCLANVFADRMRKGNGVEKPLDMIQWMVDSAQGGDRKPEVLVLKLLFLTLAAVHTSTMSATHALFDLCAMPEYIHPLRDEVRDVVEKHGWTLAAVNQMKLLDSFMKESQRINHPGLLSFNRKVVQRLKLSDGTMLPANAFITMATNSIARDPEIYNNPDSFDGARFYKKRQVGDPNRHQFVSTGPDSLPFGHGKFACPGRFFAAAQIKILLANILLRYDVSYPEGQVTRPANVFSGEGIGPDRGQRIVFSARKDVRMS
ncbi:cytochrome P450 [Nemania sp. FL0031]|nr:cytochrome P450 [Nemania sp. FL0031]